MRHEHAAETRKDQTPAAGSEARPELPAERSRLRLPGLSRGSADEGAGRPSRFWLGFLFFVLAGALLLDYGFANIGVNVGSIPVPLTGVLLAVLLARVVPDLGRELWRPLPFLLALGFIGLACIRLAFDYPTWGTLAARDFTLPLELTYLFIGYWALQRYGLEPWLRVLPWLVLALLAFLAFYPWRLDIANASPIIGLQRDVPLFGNYQGAGTTATMAFFFLALLRPFGRWSYLLAGFSLGVIFLVQLRGLYLAFPIALVLTALVARKADRRRLAGSFALSLAMGAVALAVLVPFAPEGRLGPASLDFTTEHLKTLTGASGPGSGSFRHRKELIENVFDELDRPVEWVVGVGLGPDLAEGFAAPELESGFRAEPELLTRKPHNDYLEVMARMGVIGLLLFVGTLALVFVRICRAARAATGDEARFLCWIIGTASVFLMIAATQPLLFYPFGTVPLFTLLGVGLALDERRRRASAETGAEADDDRYSGARVAAAES